MLTNKQLHDMQKRLKDRFYELRDEIRDELLDSEQQTHIELAGKVHDLEEESVANMLVDLQLASIDRHVEEIRDIDAALIRIAERSYGLCSDCECEIDIKRLTAIRRQNVVNPVRFNMKKPILNQAGRPSNQTAVEQHSGSNLISPNM